MEGSQRRRRRWESPQINPPDRRFDQHNQTARSDETHGKIAPIYTPKNRGGYSTPDRSFRVIWRAVSVTLSIPEQDLATVTGASTPPVTHTSEGTRDRDRPGPDRVCPPSRHTRPEAGLTRNRVP